ncbi:MAG TPA: DUF3011 domain-containing protein [Candidatus Competibacteraceae bacterium]|nr:DUF3011 domain-containing protein [Candidatus Competibacteraceae bacterium]
MSQSKAIIAIAALLALGFLLPWRSAWAQRFVDCESYEERQAFCRVDTRGGVRLVEQYSNSPCVEGRTWGYDRRGIWVDRGCRARFAIGRSSSERYGGTVTCESRDERYTYCRADTRGGVRLVDRLSRSPCIEGRTWGYDRRGIWVDQGCRARFALGSGGYYDDYPGWRTDPNRIRQHTDD